MLSNSRVPTTTALRGILSPYSTILVSASSLALGATPNGPLLMILTVLWVLALLTNKPDQSNTSRKTTHSWSLVAISLKLWDDGTTPATGPRSNSVIINLLSDWYTIIIISWQ